jgi:hypothetical protein
MLIDLIIYKKIRTTRKILLSAHKFKKKNEKNKI